MFACCTLHPLVTYVNRLATKTAKQANVEIFDTGVREMRGKVVYDLEALTPLARWLMEECEAQGISWAEGSRRAGVTRDLISKIVRGQYRAGPQVCRQFATAFGRPFVEVLELAGHAAARVEERAGRELDTVDLRPADLAEQIQQLPPRKAAIAYKMWHDAVVSAYAAVAMSGERGA